MKRSMFVSGAVLLLMLSVTGIAFAQGEGGGAAAEASVLGPLAAAALGIERLIETGWGIVETILPYVQRFAFLKKKDEDRTPQEKTDAANFSKFKVWASAAAGFVVGVVVANMAGLKMFSATGLASVQPTADTLVTGIVIGSGSKFAHDVVGIFTETKKLVENWAELVKSKKNDTVSGAPPAQSGG
jgi:hypothetical protein